MPTVALDIDGTLKPYGGVIRPEDVLALSKHTELAIVSSRPDCRDVARQLGIQHACCGQDKADCLRRIASEVQTQGGRIYIADLQSDFDAARAAGWDWANINDLCLNIGSGLTKFDGCVNIDVRPLETVHVVMDLLEPWPFPDGSVARIIANDVIEHIPWRRQRELWSQIAKALKPGGVLQMRVPDVELIYMRLVRPRRRESFETLYEAFSYWIGGGQDYPENTHMTFFTADAVIELAQKYGMVGSCRDDEGTNIICELKKTQ